MLKVDNDPAAGVTLAGSDTKLLQPLRLGHALAAALRSRIGASRYGLDGRLIDWTDVLMPGVDTKLLPFGPGGVDGSRLRHPEVAAAIALNSFLNWRRCPERLPLGGESGFRELRFDARCPTGVRGTPPVLDMIAANEQVVVAVTARGPEYLAQRQSRLAAAYDRLQPPDALAAWVMLLGTAREEAPPFRHVDLPALVKHALGLGLTFPERRLKLLYLFWEPVGASRVAGFSEHRRELADLAERVEGSAVQLRAQSFDELWSEWARLAEPDWLREIVARLKERYAVALPDRAAL